MFDISIQTDLEQPTAQTAMPSALHTAPTMQVSVFSTQEVQRLQTTGVAPIQRTV